MTQTKNDASEKVEKNPVQNPKVPRKRKSVKVDRQMVTIKDFEVGTSKIGRFSGTCDGKFGSLLIFNEETGENQFVLPLYGGLIDVEFVPGVLYEIEYTGDKKTSKGADFHSFKVFELEE